MSNLQRRKVGAVAPVNEGEVLKPQGKQLKVIGVGHGRTGTASLQAALNILGQGPTFHMIEIMKDYKSMMARMPGWIEAWDAVYLPYREGRPIDLQKAKQIFDGLYEGYESAIDAPTAFYWFVLPKIYPDAKLILTVRDSPDAWYKSAVSTIYEISKIRNWFERIPDIVNPISRNFMKRLKIQIWEDAMKDSMEDPVSGARAYEERNQLILDTLGKDKVLVYNVKEGWGPLCKFLGVAVPDVPFPHLNDQESFQNFIRFRKRILPAMMLAVPIIAIILLAFIIKVVMGYL